MSMSRIQFSFLLPFLTGSRHDTGTYAIGVLIKEPSSDMMTLGFRVHGKVLPFFLFLCYFFSPIFLREEVLILVVDRV